VGFEPTTPGLEARCYILAKPRARYTTEIEFRPQAASGTVWPKETFS
jgi:hypothetical protein